MLELRRALGMGSLAGGNKAHTEILRAGRRDDQAISKKELLPLDIFN